MRCEQAQHSSVVVAAAERVRRVKGPDPGPLVQVLVDTVCFGVRGAGTSAKAEAFMYIEVVAVTASLHHNRVLEMLVAKGVVKRRASCGGLAMSHCQMS